MIFDRNGMILFDGAVVVGVSPENTGYLFLLRDVSWYSEFGIVVVLGQSLRDGSVADIELPEATKIKEFEFLYYWDDRAC